MSTDQTGRVVLINGATGGLGPAVVKSFAAEGTRLVLSARSQDDLERVYTRLISNPTTSCSCQSMRSTQMRSRRVH